MFQWNMIISTIMGAQAKLCLAWIVQYSESVLDVYGIINLSIGVLILAFALFFQVLSARFAHQNKKITENWIFMSKVNQDKATQTQEKYKCISQDFCAESNVGRHFFLSQFLKTFIMVAIIYGLSMSPLAQAYLLIFLSIYIYLSAWNRKAI